MKNKFTVRIYPSAENDLHEIRDYLNNKLLISPNNLFQKLNKQIDILESNPLIYPLLKDPYLNQLGYRMVPIDNFLLFYIVDQNIVQLHRFLYAKRNYLSIL